MEQEQNLRLFNQEIEARARQILEMTSPHKYQNEEECRQADMEANNLKNALD